VFVAVRGERHDLGGARQQTPVIAEGVRVQKVALRDVRQRLDIAMRVHGPLRASDDAVVVEDSHRADAHLLGIAVLVEREVEAGAKPIPLLLVDLVRRTDSQHLGASCSCRVPDSGRLPAAFGPKRSLPIRQHPHFKSSSGVSVRN
jgi:hypothetical protein